MVIKTSPVEGMLESELVVAKAFLEVIAHQITANHDEIPADFKARQDAINDALYKAQYGAKLRRQELLEQRLNSLKTRDERRAETEKELIALRKELGLSTTTGRSKARRG